MWDIICTVILAVECLLLGWFVIGRLQKKRINNALGFAVIVYVLNLSLYAVPYLYGILEEKAKSNYLLDILDCFLNALQNFVGMFSTREASSFAEIVPVFTFTFLAGVLLAMLGTVSAAVEAFNNDIINGWRLRRAMKQVSCDIVLGSGEQARCYAKSGGNVVLLLGKDADKATVSALVEEGYVVLKKTFGPELLGSGLFRPATRYNLISLWQEAQDDHLSIYISYKKQAKVQKDIALYIEEDSSKEEAIRREIIERNGLEEWITTFCSDELLARTFTQQHPVTQWLPGELLQPDASVAPEAQIHYYYLGFTELSRHIYRQSLLNNQLVSFREGQYRLHPIHYHIWDPLCEDEAWNISGLAHMLQRLQQQKEHFFPLPELPYAVEVQKKTPDVYDGLLEIAQQAENPDTFLYILVDTGNSYRNLETAARLGSMLTGTSNYHMFVRTDGNYTQNSSLVTYYGNPQLVLRHDVIVNDALSTLARKLNQVYVAQQMGKPFQDPSVEKQALESWNRLSYFSIYSNLYAAMSLRLKLNLLGLDYVEDGKSENLHLLAEKYPRKASYDYADYFSRSKRNALLAQEHARWNAYHLLAEYLPMKKADITVKSRDGSRVHFNTKHPAAKRHACLTTFQGLDALSSALAQRATALTGSAHGAPDYDFYVYDEMLLLAAETLLAELGYSLRPMVHAAGHHEKGNHHKTVSEAV